MKKKILKIGRKILTIWGGISLVGLIVIIGYLAYSLTYGNKTRINKATKSDVAFVLNWCNLGDQRIDSVVNSYTSSYAFDGSYFDAYAIKISYVTVNELINSKVTIPGRWYRMDSLPQILDKAVSFIDEWHDKIPWFPLEDSLKSKDFYVYPWSISCQGINPTGAQLIFIEPKEKMVYYVGVAM